MKTASTSTDSIIAAACEAVGKLGLQAFTVGVVAERAGVSTALVHYHFDTKAGLLVAATSRMADQRAERRSGALERRKGLAALDALWDSLEAGVRQGSEGAYIELMLHARSDAKVASILEGARAAERRRLVGRLPGLLGEMGLPGVTGEDELAAALDSLLDGLALGLLTGQVPASLRAAYDAFWLALIGGQTPRPS